MLTRRDVEILTYFSESDKPIIDKETPFDITELRSLEDIGYLTQRDVTKYSDDKKEYPLTVKAFLISPRGKAILEDWNASMAESVKTKRIAIATLIISIIGTLATILSVIL